MILKSKLYVSSTRIIYEDVEEIELIDAEHESSDEWGKFNIRVFNDYGYYYYGRFLYLDTNSYKGSGNLVGLLMSMLREKRLNKLID